MSSESLHRVCVLMNLRLDNDHYPYVYRVVTTTLSNFSSEIKSESGRNYLREEDIGVVC